MKKELMQEIEIPEGIIVEIENNKIKVKGEVGEIERKFDRISNIILEKKDNKIIIKHKKATKKEKKIMNTMAAHIKNLLKGVKEKFEYKLKICFSHFPINVDIQGRDITVKNFLGEKIPRKARIQEGVEVKIDKEIITVSSINKELAGQAAAVFEILTKVRNKDRRIFQDGIFIINKAGKEI